MHPSPEQLTQAAQTLDEKADYLGFRDRLQEHRQLQADLRAVASWLRAVLAGGHG
jgi:hypothetical protein